MDKRELGILVVHHEGDLRLFKARPLRIESSFDVLVFVLDGCVVVEVDTAAVEENVLWRFPWI